jgi:hypothetical protein
VVAEDPGGEKSLYRQFMEEKMKCPVPSLSIRTQIYEHATRIIEGRRILGGRQSLVDVSADVARNIGAKDDGVTQMMIFKVLYALYRARAFEAETIDQPYNPTIKACKVSAEECDKLFIRNSLYVMNRERRTWPLMEIPLAELFETSWEVVAKEIDALQER